jgi:hypothetical protein
MLNIWSFDPEFPTSIPVRTVYLSSRRPHLVKCVPQERKGDLKPSARKYMPDCHSTALTSVGHLVTPERCIRAALGVPRANIQRPQSIPLPVRPLKSEPKSLKPGRIPRLSSTPRVCYMMHNTRHTRRSDFPKPKNYGLSHCWFVLKP